MTDTRFTPGPWRIEKPEDELLRFGPNHMLGARPTISIWSETDHPDNFTRDNTYHEIALVAHDDKANANLIAASPDLYAALENCQQYVVAWQLEYGTKPKDDHADKTLRDIKDALTKARGET